MNPKFTIIDVGASANPWTAEVLDAIFDFKPIVFDKQFFSGNLNEYEAWLPVIAYAQKHGKFSYSVCSHTLEDIAYPMLALRMLPQIAEAGFISMPSHFREFKRDIEGPWRGFIHHRWIYSPGNNELLVAPKIPYIEFMENVPQCVPENEEFQIYWEKEIPFKILNDDYLGPNVGYVRQYYKDVFAC